MFNKEGIKKEVAFMCAAKKESLEIETNLAWHRNLNKNG